MLLECLVLCENSQLSVLRDAWGDMGDLVCSDISAAREVLQRRRFDAVILDYDLPNSEVLLKSMRESTSNAHTIVFGLTSGVESSQYLISLGANFVMQKPVSRERASRTFGATKQLMMAARRRYFRYPINVPVSLTIGDAETNVLMTNLSEGGMALLTALPLDTRTQAIAFHFELPDLGEIAGRGEIAWREPQGRMGVRFLHLRTDGQEQLQKWLATRLGTEK